MTSRNYKTEAAGVRVYESVCPLKHQLLNSLSLATLCRLKLDARLLRDSWVSPKPIWGSGLGPWWEADSPYNLWWPGTCFL